MSSDGKEPSQTPDQTFEASLERLTAIVEKLEGGSLNLEESLRLFEEGIKLARLSQAKLDAAEKRVEELITIDEQGQPVVKQLDTE
jgi:exodeoxyribonuclease VII small subunit